MYYSYVICVVLLLWFTELNDCKKHNGFIRFALKLSYCKISNILKFSNEFDSVLVVNCFLDS